MIIPIFNNEFSPSCAEGPAVKLEMVSVEGDALVSPPRPRPRAHPGKAPQRIPKKKANALDKFQKPASSLVVLTTCISMFLLWVFVWKGVKMGRSSYTDNAQDSQIVDHYRRRGAVLRARVGRTCSTCVRGLIATEDIRTGEKVFELPVALMHSLSDEMVLVCLAPRHVVLLLDAHSLGRNLSL